MAPSDFAKANINEIAEKLTTDEAIQLMAGVGFWQTHKVDRLGIPTIKVSDGPSGIRGSRFSMGTPAKCLPCGTALGATWDTKLIEEVGLKLLAVEAKLKAASVILAPTCNIQRNPLGGRSFESFAEDPYLSGMLTASYVKGVQSGGIGSTVKHFVGNDQEDDRKGYDSIISDRALREIYLMPFMLAIKYANPWAVMTAYNRVNGPHVSEDPFLLTTILREEWSYKGMTMSDWFGTYSVDLGIKAGLDLEMPGTGKWRTLELVHRSINCRKLTTRVIRDRAKHVLELVRKCAEGAPEVLDGDGIERSLESEEDAALMRKVAAEGIVLLKNEGEVLPLKPQTLKKIAIVGGNAKAIVLSGGGSASLKASYFISPYDGIVNALAPHGVEVTYSEGARANKTLPSLDYELFTETGERGWIATWHRHLNDDSMEPSEDVFEQSLIDETKMFIFTFTPKDITRRWTVRLCGQLKPRPYDVDFEFGLCVAGRAKLYVDGNLVIDNWTFQHRAPAFFGIGTVEEKGTYPLKANMKHDILVEFCNVRGPSEEEADEAITDIMGNAGLQLGGAEVMDGDEAIARAVELAKDADAVIAVVGLNADWETEGCDRTTLALPGRTDELVSKVAAANPKTIVVTQSGSSITLPWVDSVPALVHAWYLGNSTGDAIADVLFGKHNPSGKLSLTFPKALEDVPSYGHFHSENGKVRYAEDLFVGYKHYQHRKITPLFAFGHGLSYTKFTLQGLELSTPVISGGEFSLTASLYVTNVGSVTGSEVVQLYIALPATSDLTHPLLQLKAFAKVRDLEPGASQSIELRLDKYALSYWDDRFDTWSVEKGDYRVHVGTSSNDLPLESIFNVPEGFEWKGI